MGKPDTRRGFLKSTVGATGLTIALAGCVGGDGGTAGSPIQIGAAISRSGDLASEGVPMSDGYKCMVKWINEEKGGLDIDGTSREVELVVRDDQSECETTARLYTELVNQEGIDTLLGPYTSSCTYAAGSIIQQNDAVMVQTNLSEEIFTDYNEDKNYIYTVNPLSSTTVHGMLDMVETNGANTVGMVSNNATYNQAVLAGAKEYLNDSDLELVVDESVAADTKSLSGPISKMVNEEVDFALLNTHTRNAVLGYQELLNTGYNPDMVGDAAIAATSSKFWEEFGKQSIAATSNALWDTTVDPENPPWGFGSQEAIEYYNENQEDEGWVEFDFWVINGLTPISMLLYGIEEANSTEPDDIRQALNSMEDVQGVNGLNMDFRTPDEDLGGTTDAGWNAGQKLGKGDNPIVWPEELASNEPIYPKPSWEELSERETETTSES